MQAPESRNCGIVTSIEIEISVSVNVRIFFGSNYLRCLLHQITIISIIKIHLSFEQIKKAQV